jgi:purine-binding chemotaxis protein CheW
MERVTHMDEKLNSPEQADRSISEMQGKYLTFWTDRQLFGVPIADVVQIVGMQQITSIPDFPPYAKGIINLRGAIIPVIDVRLRFHKPEVSYNERTCIIVTHIQQNTAGLIVDAVDEVTDIDDSLISAPPKMSASELQAAYLTGIGKLEQKIVLLLDIGKIVSEHEFETLSQDFVMA